MFIVTVKGQLRLSIRYDFNHSIRCQVKSGTWRRHVLYVRRYQVAAKRRNATRESLPWRRVSWLNWVGGRGEAKHKSKPNCKTNTRGWVKCRVRRDIDTHSRKSRFFLVVSFAFYRRDVLSELCLLLLIRHERPGLRLSRFLTRWNSLVQTSRLGNFVDFTRGFRCYVGNWCIKYVKSSSHDSSCASQN